MKQEKISQDNFDKLESQLILDYAKKASPKLLHQMVMEWNWDSSSPFLNWLVDNPKTDKATALMMYWTSGPRFYKQYKDRKAAKADMGNTSGFDFTESLEKKYLDGFYADANFSFDPNIKDHSGTIWTKEYSDIKTVRDIPAVMFDKIDGETVESPEDFTEGMPPDLYEQWENLYDKYEIDEDDDDEE